MTLRGSRRRSGLWNRIVGGMSLAALLLFILVATRPAQAQEAGNRAGVVVVHGAGSVLTRCVAFDDSWISGLAALERAGFDLVTSAGPLGATICSLDGEGCAASDCFCECKSADCAYWNYYHLNRDGTWAYANVGAAARRLEDGDVDGWVWGDGSTTPPSLSFEAICGAEETGPDGLAASATPDIVATVAVAATGTPASELNSTEAIAETQEAAPTPAQPGSVAPTVVPTSPVATASPGPFEDVEPSGGDAGGAPISYVGFLLILALLVAVFLIFRRREGA